jgi:hypothetical protein
MNKRTPAIIILLIVIVAFSGCTYTNPAPTSSNDRSFIINDYGDGLYSIVPKEVKSDNTKVLKEGLIEINKKCHIQSFTGLVTNVGSGMGAFGATTEIVVKVNNCNKQGNLNIGT